MTWTLIVHGGAGPARPDEDLAAGKAGCERAVDAGAAILATGGSALDAVEASVRILEDDPQFNAGTGACLNLEGDLELDACIMDGATLDAGAVSLVRGVRHPVTLARRVMERTPHLFLAGEGAMRLARAEGLEWLSPAELITPRALRRWRESRARQAAPEVTAGGTVGAVALDAHGHVAAATSTGGMSLKWPGRVGDTPLIGAGTYADDAGGAASATGHGEAIIRVVLCHAVVDGLRRGLPAQAAAEDALRTLGRVHGEAGLIAVDHTGGVGIAWNTARMHFAWRKA